VRYRNPLPGVVVLVEDAGKVLLCRRSSESFQPGRWCLPGGFIEHEEDFLSAGIREVREETGLAIAISSILSVVSNFLAPDLHTLVAVLLARVTGGSAAPGDDVVSLEWMPLQGPLPDMAFEADRHIIQRYAEDRLAGAPVDPRYCGAPGAA
jgi:ADP-ribose pyrophosphatase YjhB (NUDIX family)